MSGKVKGREGNRLLRPGADIGVGVPSVLGLLVIGYSRDTIASSSPLRLVQKR